MSPRALLHQALRLIRILRPIDIWDIRPLALIQRLVAIAFSFLRTAPVFTYVTPSRIPYNASRQDCINAFVQRAREYIGTRYIEPWSSWPGDAVDCSGLVLQCLYATGMDMGWYNPYNHRWLPEQTYNSMNWYRNNTFMPVSTSAMQRGDVVYYQGHIGIYIGNGRIIDSWPGIGVTERSVNAPGRVIGAARPFA